MSEKDIAVKMYEREHTRWNQWAIFFFGSITSVFVLYEKFQSWFNIRLPLIISAGLSILWVLAAQSIRRTSLSWRQVILELDKDENSGKAFELFDKKNQEFSSWRDLGQTLKFWSAEPYLRVTRILILIGILYTILFLALAVIIKC